MYINLRKLLTVKFIFLFIFLSSNAYTQEIKFKIIETSDVHGAVFPYDFINAKDKNRSLAQVYSYVKEEREKDQNVILLDNGDILQGQPLVYYYNFIKTDTTHIIPQVMNYMEYDAGTIGNHDIETGHKVYDRLKKEFNFPWLAANAVDEINGDPYFEPYLIIEDDGIKVAVLGLITPAIPKWLPPQIYSGIIFTDMIEAAKKWMEIIKAKENPDLMVGLFHAGLDETYNNENGTIYLNENASKLVAQNVPGFDIIYVGHDHEGWDTTITNSAGAEVLLLGPRGGAANVAVAEAVFSVDENSDVKLKSIDGYLVETDSLKADEKFLQKFKYDFNETEKFVSRRLGTIGSTISSKDALFGNSAFTDLIHKIQLDISDADISFAAPLTFNSSIDSGDVFVRDMFNLYKYENLLYTMRLSGKEIKDYLEFSYANWLNTMKDGKDHLLNFEKDSLGNFIKSDRSGSYKLASRYYNFDSAEGIDYIVDVSKPAGERIKIISMSNGENFDVNKNYEVAVNSYRGNGGGNHLTEGAGIEREELQKRIINSTEKDLRYYMMEWFSENENVTVKETENWKIIPDSLRKKGEERDRQILFGE